MPGEPCRDSANRNVSTPGWTASWCGGARTSDVERGAASSSSRWHRPAHARTTRGHYVGYPQFSPDGTRLLFHIALDGNQDADIYTMAFDGTDLAQLTDTPTANGYFADWGVDPSRGQAPEAAG